MTRPVTPLLAVDIICRLWDGDRLRGIVLIERLNEPLGLAIPGGFVDVGETTTAAAVREAREETSLDIELAYLQGIYADPDRDPRGHTVSLVYVADAWGEPKASSDAREIVISPLEDIPFSRLAFDHERILGDFLRGRRPLGQ